MKRFGFLLLAAMLFATSSWADSFPGPASPNGARIYFYRPQGSIQYLAWATVQLNGANNGSLGPGSYYYRDVAPGTYTISVNGDLPYPDDHTVLTVSPGGTAFVEVYNIDGYGAQFIMGPPPSVKFPNVYGVRPMDPSRASMEMSGLSPAGN